MSLGVILVCSNYLKHLICRLICFLSPIVIFAANRGICNVRTDMTSLRGIPINLLDRLVIIQTETYGPTEMIQFLRCYSFTNLFLLI
ncbi:unnamed protein product [Coffea canephora]|uniref:RuvB-like helicase n=1 Tax=Coffea canephora TaxID=49390 RepID=A0A068V8I7_COFCA|nr:unnamed protein product [Coffea canephora]